MLRIYYANISGLPDSPDPLPLSSYRLSQMSSCRLPLKRRQGLGAELLLIHALRSRGENLLLPLSIEKEAGGKPVLKDMDLCFSLTHSGCYAACAVSDKPVGIDLEGERQLQEAVLRRCFSAEERELILRAENPESAFFRLWTEKESYLKATGDGLRHLSTLNLLRPPADASFYHSQFGQMHLSVCVLGGSARPELLELVDLLKELY